ncbi:MAG: DUF374 domain-containing protein [Armatimonadetes bacterium]|nr:DUF374 domain-containing protein [Armatimonadota bacterium]
MGDRRRSLGRTVTDAANTMLDRYDDLVASVAWRLSWLLSTSWSVTEVDAGYRHAVCERGEVPIYAFFHGVAGSIIGFPRDRDVTLLISPHRHGRLVAKVAESQGVKVCFGSPNHRTVESFMEFAEEVAGGRSALIAVDGSKGPRGVAKPGVVLLAHRAGAPIIPCGVGAWPSYRFRQAWDRHLLPLPYARVVGVYGRPIRVQEATRECYDRAHRELQQRLNEVQSRAERLAREGVV